MTVPIVAGSLALILIFTMAVMYVALLKAIWDGFQRSVWFGSAGFFILFFSIGVIYQYYSS